MLPNSLNCSDEELQSLMDQNLNVLVILIPNMTGASWMEEATQIQIIESYDEIIQQIIDFGNISVILLKSK